MIKPAVCGSCPAWAYNHMEADERIGFCRFEPPKVSREKETRMVSGDAQEVIITHGIHPPTRESHWCLRGRVLMEKAKVVPATYLTLGVEP